MAFFSLYIAFFPQLLAGPIERPHRLIPQFHALPSRKYEDLILGWYTMLWGLF